MKEFQREDGPRQEGRSSEQTARLHMRPAGEIKQREEEEERTGWFGFSLKAQLIATFSESRQQTERAADGRRAESRSWRKRRRDCSF